MYSPDLSIRSVDDYDDKPNSKVIRLIPVQPVTSVSTDDTGKVRKLIPVQPITVRDVSPALRNVEPIKIQKLIPITEPVKTIRISPMPKNNLETVTLKRVTEPVRFNQLTPVLQSNPQPVRVVRVSKWKNLMNAFNGFSRNPRDMQPTTLQDMSSFSNGNLQTVQDMQYASKTNLQGLRASNFQSINDINSVNNTENNTKYVREIKEIHTTDITKNNSIEKENGFWRRFGGNQTNIQKESCTNCCISSSKSCNCNCEWLSHGGVGGCPLLLGLLGLLLTLALLGLLGYLIYAATQTKTTSTKRYESYNYSIIEQYYLNDPPCKNGTQLITAPPTTTIPIITPTTTTTTTTGITVITTTTDYPACVEFISRVSNSDKNGNTSNSCNKISFDNSFFFLIAFIISIIVKNS